MFSQRRPAVLYAFFSAAASLLALLVPVVWNSVPETDAWWMVPTFSQYAEGKSGFGLLAFIFDHSPRYFRPPVLKGLVWVVDTLLGLPFRAFPLIGLAIHLANGVLLVLLCRKMRLSREVSLFAGAIFVTLFVHFHAYLWLPASQHPYSLTTIFLVLWLFLATEEKKRRGKPWKGLYLLATLAALAGSFQHSGLIALAAMVCLAAAAPGGAAGRRDACDRWMPVWILFLVYPMWAMATSGDNTAISAMAKVPLPPLMKSAALLLTSAGILFGIRQLMGRGRFPWRLAGAAVALAAWVFLASRDSRQVLLPYNALVPFMTSLGSFLDPFQSALRMESSEAYHYAQAEVSPALFLLSLIVIGLFSLGFARQKRGLAVWGVWYGIALAYLLLHKHVASAMPFRTQSRYFLYLSPVFSVMMACALAYGVTALARWGRWRRGLRDAALLLALAALCVPNLLAIRLALFRGSMVNSYFIYDDLRASALIAEDLKDADPAGKVDVEGLTPFWFRKKWSEPVDGERIAFDNFRRILADRIGHRRPLGLSGRRDAPSAGAYRIEGRQVFSPDGRPLDLFREELDSGLALWREGDAGAALGRFREAALRRPFLVNYLMGPEGRLSDAEWVTGGRDLRDWLEWMGRRYRRWSIAPVEKWESVSSLVRGELSDYLLCLTALAFLEEQAGNSGRARRQLSQIYFLERDPERLEELLREDSRVGGLVALSEFSARFRDPEWFSNPVPWTKNDYAFGRFLMRAVFGVDIRSGWDRQTGEAA